MTLSVNLTAVNGRRCMGFENELGIKPHNWFTAIFAQIFGSGVFKMKEADGKEFYYSKGSLVRWIKEAEEFVRTKNKYDKREITDKVSDSDAMLKASFTYWTSEVRETMNRFAPKEAK